MNKRDIWTCSLLGLVSLMVRMMLISKGPFSPESLNLALKAEQTLDTFQLPYLIETGYPLTVIATAAAICVGRFLGIEDPVFAANLMSVYISALAIPVFYMLVRRWTNVPTAVLSSMLLSLSPIYLGISVYAKGHAPAMFFCFAGLLVLSKFCESREANHLFFGSLLIGCLGAARLQDMALVLPVALIMIFWNQDSNSDPVGWRERLLNAGMFLVSTFLVVYVFHMPYLIGAGREEYVAQYQNFVNLTVSGMREQNWSISLGLYIKWFLTNFSFWGILSACLGFFLLLRKQRRVALLCAVWFIIPVCFYLVINTTIPRSFTILIPPITILMAYFCGYGFRRDDFASAALGVLIAVMLAGSVFLNIYPVLQERNRNAHIPEYVQWVKSQVPSNAIIIAKDDFIFYEHYGKLQTMTRPNPMGQNYPKIFCAYREKLQFMLAQGIPIYTSGVGLYSYDPHKQLANYLKKTITFEEIGRHPYEVYHAGELQNVIFPDPLYRLSLSK